MGLPFSKSNKTRESGDKKLRVSKCVSREKDNFSIAKMKNTYKNLLLTVLTGKIWKYYQLQQRCLPYIFLYNTT